MTRRSDINVRAGRPDDAASIAALFDELQAQLGDRGGTFSKDVILGMASARRGHLTRWLLVEKRLSSATCCFTTFYEPALAPR